MDDNFSTHGAKWFSIVIKWFMEVLTCRDLRVETGLALDIGHEFYLQEESVPQVSWESGIKPVQYREKMGFECPDR